MKYEIGREFLANPETDSDEMLDGIIQDYVDAMRSARPPGTTIPGREEKFREMCNGAEQYQKLHQGWLKYEVTKQEGFLTYRTDSIFQHPERKDSTFGFWSRALTEFPEFTLASVNGQVEVFIHDWFIEEHDEI